MEPPISHATPGIEWLQHRLAHLQALSAALAGARSEQAAIDATLDSGLAVFEADQAVVATLDDGGAALSIRATRGYSQSIRDEWSAFPNTDEFPLSEAVRQQRPVIVYGAQELTRRYPKLAGTARSAVLVCLPLGEAAGVALGYDSERRFTEPEVEFMTAVARQCGEAIRRSQLDGERRRRAQRLALLAEAGQAFAGTLDYRATLAEVAQLAVPRLADCCIVDVLEPSGVHQVATVHVEPQRIEQVAELERRYPADPGESRSAVGAVLRTGRATVLPEVSELFLQGITRGREHLEAVRALGMHSLIIAPLVARGRTLGAITLIHDVSGRRYDEQDLDTATSLADRAALAIDNARLHEAQVGIATALQRGLLPRRLPELPGLDVATRYLAAGEGLEVGGDFYDLWRLGSGFGLAIGDVSGKGAVAASMTALARHTVRVASLHEPTPSRVLAVLDDEIKQHGAPGLFVTAAYAHGVPAAGAVRLTVALGGHPPGLVRRGDGTVEEAGRLGTLLGVNEQVSLTDHTLTLAAGDVLVLYTDGVTEHRNGSSMFGEQRLADVVRAVAPGATADQVAIALEQAIQRFAAGPPRDDIAIVALRVE